MDTIFAHCSGKGKAGVAVFRISGPDSLSVVLELTKKTKEDLPPRRMVFSKIHDPRDSKLIDEGMVVYFSNKASFTGEESAEIHTHGSLAVIKLLNNTLFSHHKVRLAEPGEFARRAFLNGKFDLTSAEGLADLIEAETEMQHAQAIRQLGGGLAKLYEEWRAKLLDILAYLEAYIDFPEEEIPDEVTNRANELVESLCSSIKEHLTDNRKGERLRDGLKLAIIGKPNVGKSSLLNYLMQRDVAIVSNIAGTTRDIIEGHLDIGGYPMILQDTAGIRDESNDEIEMIGIERARQIHKEADIKLIILEARELIESSNRALSPFSELIDEGTVIICNKVDLLADTSQLPKMIDDNKIVSISVAKEQGLKELMQIISQKAEQLAAPGENPMITRERHRIQLQGALEALEQFKHVEDLILATEDLRMTIRYLSNITGTITADEVLGEIFSKFCIGK